VITVKDGQAHFEGQDISLEGLANMAGFLQVFVGHESLKMGLGMEDIKDYMLDIHLAAIEAVEAQKEKWSKEGGNNEDSV